MTLDPLLANARGLRGERRFYPPGQHPATARLRAHAARLRTFPPSRDRNAALDHVEGLVAAFEERHAEDKHRHASMFR